MPTAQWEPERGKYAVYRRGSLVSTHNKANRAKQAAKRLGRKHAEPVSYKGKRGATKFIYRPDPEDQFGSGAGSGGSGLRDLLG